MAVYTYIVHITMRKLKFNTVKHSYSITYVKRERPCTDLLESLRDVSVVILYSMSFVTHNQIRPRNTQGTLDIWERGGD